MKCTIPEISWHNRDPVLSVDVQSGKEDDFYRVASGGTDSHVVVWHLHIKGSGMAEVNCVADLQRHQRAVNTVRFSPSGVFLASGDDESAIIIWKQKTDQDAPELPCGVVETNAEQWLHVKILRGHVEDVYDLCWSPDSSCLVSGSVDNTAILWDVHKGRHTAILSDHKGFVQGVAWDPKNQYVATLSSDRTCRVFNVQTRRVVCRVSKAPLPVPEGSDSELEGKPLRLFYDDTLKSFFRRLAFSPDGELLFAPSGIVESPDANKHGNATHVFMRRMFNRPVMYLPSPDQYTVAVRCCPVLFRLHDGDSMFALPYRMVVAVATQSSIVLYDTQQPEPFGIVSNIHYTRLTDLAWSSDGRVLMVASTDGFCSIVTFSEGELGEVYVPAKNSAGSTTAPVDERNASKMCHEENMGSDVQTAIVDSPVVENKTTEVAQKTNSAECDKSKEVVLGSAVDEKPGKKKPIRRIQPITLSGKNSPRKLKDGIADHSELPESSQSENISSSSNNTQTCESSKDEITPCGSIAQHDVDCNEVMEVVGDSSIVKTDSESKVCMQSDVPADDGKLSPRKSPTETVPVPIGSTVFNSKPDISDPKEVQVDPVSPKKSVVTSSHIRGKLDPNSVSVCVEVSELKDQLVAIKTTTSDKSGGVEKMDVDECEKSDAIIGGGDGELVPEKEIVRDESLGCDTLEMTQITMNESKESKQEPSCTADSDSSMLEWLHKTPSKTATADVPAPEIPTSAGSCREEENAKTPTSPISQTKKTPRRVQLITLSSPKSKRSLLQS